MSRTSTHRGVARVVGVAAVAVITVGGLAVPAAAVPPPPPNPSDSDINSSQQQADQKAGQVGKLNNQLSQAEQQLQRLDDNVQLKEEQANKALVDLQTAQSQQQQADAQAQDAQRDADQANADIDKANRDLDEFAANSFEQGSTVGSVSAFIGAKSPSEVLQRAQLLDAISGSKLNALDELQQARTEKANKDSTARAAAQRAQQKRAAAAQAKQNADSAQSDAIQAQQQQQSQTSQLQATQADLEKQLYAAQQKVGGLKAQREKYDQWLREKQAEDAERAREAAAARSAASGPVSAPAVGSVAAVINRAKSVLGITYAWGGGNAYGPTYGIHDGGVADAYGDYHKIGFDCSGLMVYSFAAAGVSLPHYSGYQYLAGQHVPLSQMQPGDMIFYGDAAGIYHVTLYIGGGMMIEAPESGEVVHITPVRYDEIMPYATRVL
ncbi:MAG: C40 family peptidase [Sciscionella sp.]|nr:C40 family peptidase [Sciscionella sp.]